MNHKELKKYPIDFDALEKGTVLETQFLAEAIGLTPADQPRWSLALLRLQQQIIGQAGIVAAIDHNRIRLLTDEEADEYLYRATESGVAKIVRAARRRALIDRSGMTAERRDLAERRDRLAISVATSSQNELRRQRRIEQLMFRPTLGLDQGE